MYTPHLLVTFGGTLNEQSAQDEIWQCGVRCSFESPFDEELYVAEIADNMAAWFQLAQSWNSDASRLVWLKAARIAADGGYPSPTYSAPTADYASPPAGASANIGMPSFCSVAYSWKSEDHRRGPGSNGRVYPPNFGAPIIRGTGTIAGSTAAELCTGAVGLLAAIRNADNTQIVSPGIFSKVDGTASVITSVRVGNVVDTQRRRKNKLPEQYQALAFA